MTLDEMFPNATPVPWKLGRVTILLARAEVTSEGNRALVEHAVNTYDARDEALRAALDYLKNHVLRTPVQYRDVVAKVETALKVKP